MIGSVYILQTIKMLVPFYTDLFKYDLSDNENVITQPCISKK